MSAGASSDVVPEFWPPLEATEPIRPRRIYWLFAPLIVVPAAVFPRRLGPHVSESSWQAAVTAHVFCIALFFGLLAAAAMDAGMRADDRFAYPALPLWEQVRRPFAALVVLLTLMQSQLNLLTVAAASVAVGVVEAAMWIVALLIFPLVAAGERPGRAYFRAVKLVYWSSGCAVILAFAFSKLIPLAIPHFDAMDQEEGWWVFYATVFVSLFWWLCTAVQLGRRYGGPKNGPRWAPRSPRCESCAYALTGLAQAGRCPECGRAVSESLSEHRHPPAFAEATNAFARMPAFFVTVRRSLSAQRFAADLSLHRGHAGARDFSRILCVLIGCAASLTLAPLWVIGMGSWPAQAAVFAALGAGGALLTFLMLLLSLLGAAFFRWRSPAERSVVCCYALTWLVVPALLGIAGVWTYRWIGWQHDLHGVYRLAFGQFVERAHLVGCAVMLPCVATLVIWPLHLRAMFRQTRYANG